MRSKGLQTGLIGVLLLAGTPASAVVIAEYTFTGNSQASTDLSPETIATDANFGLWTDAGSKIGFSSDSAFARAEVTSNVLSNGLSGAIEHNDYLGFTIQGSGFDITSIAFSHSMTDTDGGNTYQAHLFTDATGFGAGDVLQTSTINGTGSSVPGGITFDATTNAAFQGIASDIEVRIYFTDSQNPTYAHIIDNIVVQGTPEPGSLALLGLGGVCLFRRRYRA